MNRIFFVLALTILISGIGCSRKSVKPTNFNATGGFTDNSMALVSRDADQAVELGSAYCRQGSYDKGADLYDQAAEMYSSAGDEDLERKAAVAGAKMHLKASDREAFLISAARLKGLIGRYEMPSEDERLLLNLAAHMQKQDLPYPLKPEWRIIFNQ